MRLKSFLQTYRLAVLVLFVTVALFIIASLGFDVMGLFYPEQKYLYYSGTFIALIGTLIAFAAFLNKYLGKVDEGVTNISEGASKNFDTKKENDSIKREQEDLRNDFAKLRALIKKDQGSALSDNKIDELVTTLKERIYSEATDVIINELNEKVAKLLNSETQLRLEIHFQRMMKRLSIEISELGKRAKVNLIIGSVTALAGVSIFLLFVFERVSPEMANSYLVTEFAPRISLVIVIEVFAYFFLGLYKNNLSEIKYFHNELTNIESKYMAIEEAIASADTDTVQEILKSLSTTERNFLLKKGESTVSLEDKRITVDEQKGIINALLSNVAKQKQ